MDPISLGMGVVGLGMSIFGSLSSASVSGQESKVSQDEAQQEIGINNAKQQAMEINGRRTQLQNLRNNQLARAQATNAATNQGAQFGSGLAGGLGQIQANTAFNMQGVNDALQTGRQINSFNNQIDNDKMQMASLGATQATDQGIASIGGAIMKAGPMVGAMSQGMGSGIPGSGSNSMFFKNSGWGIG